MSTPSDSVPAPAHRFNSVTSAGQTVSLIYLVLALALTACTQRLAVTPEPVTLRIAGSTSMSRVLRDLARAYEAAHPNVLIDLRGGGSTLGVSALLAGEADLAAVSWKPEAKAVPDDIQAVPIARDGIAVIVHPTNRTPGLTILQLRALFRGEMLDWATVGGRSEEPIIISREDGSGDRAAFETLVMGGDRVTLNAIVMPSSEAVVEYVAGHPGAIGYVSMADLIDGVRAVPVEEALPTRAAVSAGLYHLSRPLYLFAPKPSPATARAFLDFVLSPAGQAIVARHHAALR